MAKEYQSEKSPIFDSQKSKKTRRKLLKMSHIKAYKVDQMFCNTRYIRAKNAQFRQYEFSTICHCRFKSHADPLMDTHHNPLSELLGPGHHCPLQHRVATLTAPH